VFSTARRADDVASDAPCRIRRSPTWLSPNRTSPDARPASTAASSKAAASTNQSAFHRRVPPPPACADFTGDPPPAHDFAVAFRLPTPVRRSAGERLDPPPSGDRPGAARRLLQSDTIHEHDRSNRLSLDRATPRSVPRPPIKACTFESNVGRRLLSHRDRDLAETRPRPRRAAFA
jgi:hypothetical protein